MQAETRLFCSDTRGFTLLEVLIAITIGILIISTVLGFFWMQRSSADLQQDVAAVQQDLRGISQMLASNIRIAGYNPQHQEDFNDFVDCGAAALTPGFQGSDAEQPAIRFHNQDCDQTNVTTDATNIAFVADINGDGRINRTAGPPIEQIAYRFTPVCAGSRSGCLEQYSPGANPSWQPVAQNIDGVEFLYHLSNGPDVTNPAQVQLNNIRAVTVTILARAASPKRDFINNNIYRPASCGNPAAPCDQAFNGGNPWNDNFLRQMLTFTVQCRNL